jgi:multiple sugar transport system substrate-binding protein
MQAQQKAHAMLDEIIKSVLPRWKRAHPDVEIKLISKPYADHHAAMGAALGSGAGLPDVMAIEFGFLGKFADTGKLEDLGAAPYSIRSRQLRFVPYAFKQAIDPSGAVSSLPSDIGPGTLFYRNDIIRKAGVSEADLTQSWESFIAAGVKIKAKTGAYLMANARDIKDIIIRTDTKASNDLIAYWRPGGGTSNCAYCSSVSVKPSMVSSIDRSTHWPRPSAWRWCKAAPMAPKA